MKLLRHRIFSAPRLLLMVFVLLFQGALNLYGSVTTGLADYVLGQPDFNTAKAVVNSPNGMANPTGVAVDPVHGWLFVMDSTNARILVFNISAGFSNGMTPSYVIGQPDFVSRNSAPLATTLGNNPTTMKLFCMDWFCDLYVTDTYNNRVLIYNIISGWQNNLANGMAPANVIGQNNLNSNSPNAGAAGPNAIGLNHPTGIDIDQTTGHIFIADAGNSRVLEFSKLNGSPADIVLGQPDFVTVTPATSQNQMSSPSAVTYDSIHHRLFVSDAGRVLVYDLSTPPMDGMNAAYELGRANFTAAAGLNPKFTLNNPLGATFDPASGEFYAADSGTNRVVSFDLSNGISNGMNMSAALPGTPGSVNTFILGGSTFVSGPGPDHFDHPSEATYDPYNRRLYVADTNDNRVLVYNDAPSAPSWCNDASASFVLGQPDFKSNSPSAGPNGLHGPSAVLFDPLTHRLFASDQGNNRILIYDLSAGITNGMNAQYVLGQPDFISNFGSLGDGVVNRPSGMAYDPSMQKLWVTDTANNRMLMWYLAGGITNGMPCSSIFGHCIYNDNTSGSGNSMNSPEGAYYDLHSRQLYMSDSGNNRILGWDDSAGMKDCEGPQYELGQPDFLSQTPATTPAGLSNPQGLAVDPDRKWLYAADQNNNRIVVYDLSGGVQNGMNASYALGQLDLNSKLMAVSQTGLNGPLGMAYDPFSHDLYDTDTLNNRSLIFDAHGGVTNGMAATSELGQPAFTTNLAASTSRGMNVPSGAAYDPISQRLFVADSQNNRILVYTSGQGCSNVCGAAKTICGVVSSAETNSNNQPLTTLSGVALELRDSQGNFLQQTKSEVNGDYSFGSLTLGSSYYVMPVVGRTETAIPLQTPVLNLQSVGAYVAPSILGWPGSVQISGSPAASFVLISTYSYTGATPPPIQPGSGTGGINYSGLVGLDGTTSIAVPALPSTAPGYYVTCWQTNLSGTTATQMRVPDITIGSTSLGSSIVPGQSVNYACH